MQISLIITTYNWKEALELSLNSALNQTIKPNEIIIADDGSTDNTLELITKITQKIDIKIIHSWQEDNGFRAAGSRNLAIKKSSFEYIICIDGDMILDKDFIKNHLDIAEQNCYVQGSRVLLNNKDTQDILQNKIFNPPKLFAKNTRNNENGFKNIFLSKLLAYKKSQNFKGIKSCNFAFFKQDFIKVNGFNEDFISWGREDSELIARLYNIGIQRKNLKFGGIQYHLFHNESNSNSKNDKILAKTKAEKLIWCSNGLIKNK